MIFWIVLFNFQAKGFFSNLNLFADQAGKYPAQLGYYADEATEMAIRPFRLPRSEFCPHFCKHLFLRCETVSTVYHPGVRKDLFSYFVRDSSFHRNDIIDAKVFILHTFYLLLDT